MRDKAITIRKQGIGDGIQFSSLPENYFRATGKKLIDLSKPWFFDHNPFVDRENINGDHESIEMWNYPQKYPWPVVRGSVHLSNAEIHAAVLGLKNPPLIRPRLYRFEEMPFKNRSMILFHAFGVSQGALPHEVIRHVNLKYKSEDLYQIGLPTDPDLGIYRLLTPTMWTLALAISQARMFIGVDSGPAWIAACYPDVITKKIRTTFQGGFREPHDWIPLEEKHPHSYWDDQGLFQIYNTTGDDIGFTQSYKKL